MQQRAAGLRRWHKAPAFRTRVLCGLCSLCTDPCATRALAEKRKCPSGVVRVHGQSPARPPVPVGVACVQGPPAGRGSGLTHLTRAD
eukprot:4274152-Lingulodinium_polyedra.AAC.1